MAEQRTSWLDRFLDAPPPEMEELPFDAVDLACMIGMAIAWNTAPALGLLVTGVSIAQRIGRRNPATAAQLLALADHNPLVAKLLPGAQAPQLENETQTETQTTKSTTGDLSDLVQQPPTHAAPTPSQQTARNWIKLINDDIESLPHLAMVGPTRSGKTTLMTGILLARVGKGGRISVISAKSDDGWGGLPYISLDDDLTFTSAEQALVNVNQELLKRMRQRKREQQAGIPNTPEPLTVVLDDFAQLRKACKSADDVVLNLARLGRSSRMRLVLMTYAWQVRELGLEGLGESRAHFALIETKRTKTDPPRRTATMEFDDTTYQRETAPIVDLARRLRFEPGRWWEPLPTPVEVKVSTVSTADDLLASLLGSSVPVRNSQVTTPPVTNTVTSVVTGCSSDVSPVTSVTITADERDFIMFELGRNTAPSMIARKLPGYTPTEYKRYKAKVDYVKTQLAAATNTPPATGDDDDVPPAFKRAMGN
jgi:hypothetical protein